MLANIYSKDVWGEVVRQYVLYIMLITKKPLEIIIPFKSTLNKKRLQMNGDCTIKYSHGI